MQKTKPSLYQELLIPQNLVFKKMPVSAACHICKKGLQDGSSLTAKRLSKGLVFLCDLHYFTN